MDEEHKHLLDDYHELELWPSASSSSALVDEPTLAGFAETSKLEAVAPDLAQSLALNRTFKVHEVLSHDALNTTDGSPECVLSEFHKHRYAPMLPQTYPVGAFPWRLHSWQPHTLPRHKLKYFIAVNLYNSTDVTPSIIKALTEVLTLLGPHRFHVSIYENGWVDNEWHDRTPAQLYLFAKALEALGAGHTIISDSDRPPGWQPFKRIPGLAEVRNLAMKPLYDAPPGTFDRVIFLNDVHFCPADLLELMYQHEVQEADQSCGMDYKRQGPRSSSLKIPIFQPDYPILFYDVWVARDANGYEFQQIDDGGGWAIPTPLLPHAPPGDQDRFYDNLPIQVYSCWNGVTVIDAAVFRPVHSLPSISFSTLATPDSRNETARSASQGTVADDAADVASAEAGLRFRALDDSDIRSECFLFCQDLWRLKAHNKTVEQLRQDRQYFAPPKVIDDLSLSERQALDDRIGRGARIQVVPRTSVAYFMEDYRRKRQDWNVTTLQVEGDELVKQRKLELINWKDEPPQSVHAYLYAKWDRRVDIPPY
ncbi:hypothetical protein OIV83_006310 [Microbotryomycetes sp. JL201]|nr:hypothetical protein OIV83_006310 [Microbotryomycetes sp. JL201]